MAKRAAQYQLNQDNCDDDDCEEVPNKDPEPSAPVDLSDRIIKKAVRRLNKPSSQDSSAKQPSTNIFKGFTGFSTSVAQKSTGPSGTSNFSFASLPQATGFQSSSSFSIGSTTLATVSSTSTAVFNSLTAAQAVISSTPLTLTRTTAGSFLSGSVLSSSTLPSHSSTLFTSPSSTTQTPVPGGDSSSGPLLLSVNGACTNLGADNQSSRIIKRELLEEVKDLNQTFFSWIQVHMASDPCADFSPVCEDYIKHILNLEVKHNVPSVSANLPSQSALSRSVKTSEPGPTPMLTNPPACSQLGVTLATTSQPMFEFGANGKSAGAISSSQLGSTPLYSSHLSQLPSAGPTSGSSLWSGGTTDSTVANLPVSSVPSSITTFHPQVSSAILTNQFEPSSGAQNRSSETVPVDTPKPLFSFGTSQTKVDVGTVSASFPRPVASNVDDIKGSTHVGAATVTKPAFSFGMGVSRTVSDSIAASVPVPTPTFSFGCVTKPETDKGLAAATKPFFLFGDPGKAGVGSLAPAFSFGSAPAGSGSGSITTPTPTPTTTTGANPPYSTSSSKHTCPFSFQSKGETPLASISKDPANTGGMETNPVQDGPRPGHSFKPIFSFGSSSSSAGITFGSATAAPPQPFGGFSFNPPKSDSSTTTLNAPVFFHGTTEHSKGPDFPVKKPDTAVTEGGSDGENDEEPVPPEEPVVSAREEDAFHQVKCKLFYKKENNWIDLGVGNAFLRDISGAVQLVVRMDTSTGRILLNVAVSSQMPVTRSGKNNVMVVAPPNPPIEGLKGVEFVTYLLRVKTTEDADELLGKMKKSVPTKCDT